MAKMTFSRTIHVDTTGGLTKITVANCLIRFSVVSCAESAVRLDPEFDGVQMDGDIYAAYVIGAEKYCLWANSPW